MRNTPSAAVSMPGGGFTLVQLAFIRALSRATLAELGREVTRGMAVMPPLGGVWGSATCGARRRSKRTPASGVAAQDGAIRTCCSRLGLTLTDTFQDLGISGGLALEDRPGLLAALDAIKKSVTLVFAKRDRLGRSVLNVAMIERLVDRKGARIVSAAREGTDTNDPTSRLMRQIIDAIPSMNAR